MTPLVAVQKKQRMTVSEVVRIVRDGQRGKSLRDYASEIGISPAYLSDIYAGKRSPGQKCLEYFGISKKSTVVVEYVFERKR